MKQAWHNDGKGEQSNWKMSSIRFEPVRDLKLPSARLQNDAFWHMNPSLARVTYSNKFAGNSLDSYEGRNRIRRKCAENLDTWRTRWRSWRSSSQFSRKTQTFQKWKTSISFNSSCLVHQRSSIISWKNNIKFINRRKSKTTSKLESHGSSWI